MSRKRINRQALETAIDDSSFDIWAFAPLVLGEDNDEGSLGEFQVTRNGNTVSVKLHVRRGQAFGKVALYFSLEGEDGDCAGAMYPDDGVVVTFVPAEVVSAEEQSPGKQEGEQPSPAAETSAGAPIQLSPDLD